MKQSFAQAWRDYRLLLCIGLAYAVLCSLQIFAIGISTRGYLSWLWMTFRTIVGFSYFFWMCLALVTFLKHLGQSRGNIERAADSFSAALRQYVAGPAFAGGILGLAATYFSVFFILQKATLRWVNPYAWDEDFAAWDLQLHGGVAPYQRLFSLFGDMPVDGFLQAAYLGWFGLMYFSLGCCLFWDADRVRKQQFVWVFFLAWALLGGFAATYFSSAGPAFYAHVLPGNDPFQPLQQHFTAHAAETPAISFIYKKLMEWEAHTATIVPNIMSAMPSMHAAISTLVVLYAWSIGWPAFTLAVAAGASIVVSSIYFGFHYAIDSYCSIVAVFVLWVAAGWLIRRRLAREEA